MTLRLNKSNFSTIAYSALMVLIFYSPNCLARDIESLELITKSVHDYLTSEIQSLEWKDTEVKIRSLDSRLKLTKCSNELLLSVNQSSVPVGKFTIAVKCTQPKPWVLNVPVEVIVYKTVLAASRPLSRGHTITTQDFMPVMVKLGHRENGFYKNPENLVGMVVKRSLGKGKPFKPHFIQAPHLIRRGEHVMIIAQTSTMRVSMKGQALSDGAKGQVIQVRNLSTRRVIEGVVKRPGVVHVRM